MTRKEKFGILGRALICVLICAAVIGAAYAVLYALGLSDITREEIQAAVSSSGAWAPPVFILISFLQVTFIPIPSTVTVLAGAYIFGALPSFFYSFLGICLGAIVAFELGRGIGRPFARWVVGSEAQLDSLIAKLKGRERALLWIMFFCPFFPDDALCTVAGLLKVSRLEFLFMQLITRTTSIGTTLVFMSGELIPYEGLGLVIISVGALLFVAASVLALIYFERIDALARRLADRLTGRKAEEETTICENINTGVYMTDEAVLEKEAKKELERGYEQAEKLLGDKDKLGKFLRDVEEKSKNIPLLGDLLSRVTVLIEMIKEYTEGTYRNMPIATAVAIVSALAYFISPIDLVTDALPVIGHIDDAAVIGACFSLINDDIEKYTKWRKTTEEKLKK